MTTHRFGDSLEGLRLRGSCNHSCCLLQQKHARQGQQRKGTWGSLGEPRAGLQFSFWQPGVVAQNMLWPSGVKCRNMCSVFAQRSPFKTQSSVFLLLVTQPLPDCATSYNYWNSRLSEGKQVLILNYIIHTNNLGRLLEQDSVPQAHTATLSFSSTGYTPEAKSQELSSRPLRDSNIWSAILELFPAEWNKKIQ